MRGKVITRITSSKEVKRVLMNAWFNWACCMVGAVLGKAVVGFAPFGAGIAAMIDLIFGNHKIPLYDYSIFFGMIFA